MVRIGYAWAAAEEGAACLDHQLQTLRDTGCERIHTEPGASLDGRTGLKRCLAALERYDTLVVTDLDRMGMVSDALFGLLEGFGKRGIGFEAIGADFDTTTQRARAFLAIRAAFQDMDERVGRQRVAHGSAPISSHNRGGRPRLMTAERLRHGQYLVADRGLSVEAAARELGGVKVSSLYHYMRSGGALKGPGLALLADDETARVHQLEPGVS